MTFVSFADWKTTPFVFSVPLPATRCSDYLKRHLLPLQFQKCPLFWWWKSWYPKCVRVMCVCACKSASSSSSFSGNIWRTRRSTRVSGRKKESDRGMEKESGRETSACTASLHEYVLVCLHNSETRASIIMYMCATVWMYKCTRKWLSILRTGVLLEHLVSLAFYLCQVHQHKYALCAHTCSVHPTRSHMPEHSFSRSLGLLEHFLI